MEDSGIDNLNRFSYACTRYRNPFQTPIQSPFIAAHYCLYKKLPFQNEMYFTISHVHSFHFFQKTCFMRT